MATPIFIAYNQTASPIELTKLALTIPASSVVTLSDYNTTEEIQSDEQLKALITAGTVLLGNGAFTLNKDQSLAYCSSPASTVDVGDFVDTSSSSGVITGGEVTATGGTGISVAAGTGLCVRGDPYYDAVKVSWSTTPFTLGSSGYYYVYYDFSAGALVAIPAPRIGEDIQLAQVRTDGSALKFLHKTRTPLYRPSKVLDEYLIDTRKIAHVSGTLASAGTAGRKFQISAGSYYRSLDKIDYAGSGGDATFSYWYGTNGASEQASQTEVNITQYDVAGTLTSMTASYWRADSLLITSDGRISVIYGTAEYATEALAEEAPFASIPGKMSSTACTVALLLVQQGNGITKFVDARPIASAAVAGGTGVTVHGALDGLSADDHLQYLLAAGGRAMSGNLDMGGQNITNVNLVDGVDIPAHVGAGGSAHAAVTTSVNGFMTAADKTKMAKYPADMCNGGYAYANAATTTTSTTDVAMPDTVAVLGAGRHIVWFSGDLSHSTASATIEVSIYGTVSGRQLNSVKLWQRGASQGNVKTSFMCMSVVPGNQTVQGYWKTSAATASCENRAMHFLKIADP